MSVVSTEFDYTLPGGLPVELWMYILQFVGLEFFPSVAQVSLIFNVLARDKLLVRKIAPHALDGRYLYHLTMWPEFIAWLHAFPTTIFIAAQAGNGAADALETCCKKIRKTAASQRRATRPKTRERLARTMMALEAERKRHTQNTTNADSRHSRLLNLRHDLTYLLDTPPTTWIYRRREASIPAPPTRTTVIKSFGLACGKRWNDSYTDEYAEVMFSAMCDNVVKTVDILARHRFTSITVRTVAVTVAIADHPGFVAAFVERDMYDSPFGKGMIANIFHNAKRYPCPNILRGIFDHLGKFSPATIELFGIEELVHRWHAKHGSITTQFGLGMWSSALADEIHTVATMSSTFAQISENIVGKDCVASIEMMFRSKAPHLPPSEFKARLLMQYLSRNTCGPKGFWDASLCDLVCGGFVAVSDLLDAVPKAAKIIEDVVEGEDAMIVSKLLLSDGNVDDKIRALRIAHKCGVALAPLVADCSFNAADLVKIVRAFSRTHHASLMSAAFDGGNAMLACVLVDVGFEPTESDWARARELAEDGVEAFLKVFEVARARVVFD